MNIQAHLMQLAGRRDLWQNNYGIWKFVWTWNYIFLLNV